MLNGQILGLYNRELKCLHVIFQFINNLHISYQRKYGLYKYHELDLFLCVNIIR